LLLFWSNGLNNKSYSFYFDDVPLPPVAEDQSFCGSAAIGDLSAEGETGAVFSWYSSATGGTALSGTDEITASGTYYVSQTVSGEESDRTAVEITIKEIPAAPVAEAQDFCGSAEIGDLSAEGETGSVYNWYTLASGGTILSETDEITTSGTYYVSQTVDGCESERTSVEVTIKEIPAAPVAEAQDFCGSTAIGDLSAEGETGAVYNWYTSASGGTILSDTDEITTSGTYYVSQSVDGCESERTSVALTIKPIPTAPTVLSQAFCGESTVADLVAEGEEGAALNWYDSLASTTPLASTAVLSNGVYYVTQVINGCESEKVAFYVGLMTESIVGTGTSTQIYPLGNWYGYERSAALYTKEEIGLFGALSSIAWEANLAGQGSRPIKIYLKETSEAVLTTGITWNSITTDATLVYDGSVTPVLGWNTFTLTNSFTYSGNNNLLVLVEANVGGSGSTGSDGNQIRYSTAANKHRWWRDDGSAPTDNGTVSNNRPNVTFNFGGGDDDAIVCSLPSNFNLDNTTLESVSVSWGEGDSTPSGEYMLYISEENVAPSFCEITDITTTETEFIFEELEAETSYYIWMRSDCESEGGLSAWVGPITAFTGYCEVSTTNSGDYTSAFSTTNAYQNALYTADTQPTGSYSNQTFQLITQEAGASFDFSTTYVGGGNGVRIWIDYNNDLVFDDTEMVFSLYSSDLTKTGTITIPAGTPVGQYRMRVRSLWNTLPVACGNVSYGSTIDFTLNVVPTPTCFMPTDLNIAAGTQTSVTLNWTAPETGGGNYDVYISTETVAPTDATTPTDTTTDTSYTFEDLEPETLYHLWVRTNCGSVDGTSFWANISFYTDYCVVSSTYTGNRIEGFSTLEGYTNISNLNNGTANAYSDYTDLVVTQSEGGSFNYQVAVPSYTNVEIWIDFNNNLIFETNELVAAHTYNSSATTFTGTIAIPSGIEEGDYRIRVRSRYYYNTDANPCGNVTYGEAEDYTLTIVPVPTCMPPAGVAITHTSEDSVTVSWTAVEGQDTWQVLVLPAGSPAPDENTTGFVETNDNPYTEEGLDSETEYVVYVRANCGAADGVSFWAGPAKGKTTQIPAELPYDEGFEGENNWSFVGTGDNQWVFGTAVNNGGTHALYVSKDEGATHTYNTSSTTVAHAYRDFLVEQVNGQLEISFDWMAKGEGFSSTKWDYLNVWLVPSSYNPTPGTLIESTPNNGAQLMYRRNDNSEFISELFTIDLNTLNAYFDNGYFRIVFEWINDGGSGTQPPGAIDNLLIKKITCPQVIDLESEIRINSDGEFGVMLTWTPTGDETQWEVFIVPFDDPTVPDENAEGIIVNNPRYFFVDEEHDPDAATCDNKFFKFYVRPICSEEDKGRWRGPGIISFIPPPGCADVEAEIVFSDVEGLEPNENGDYVICQDEPINLTLSATYYDIPGTETYEVEAIEYCPPFPFTGGGAIELTDDDIWSGVIDLGFDFCYFGNSYNQALISTNGIITFSIDGIVEGGRYTPGDNNTIYYPSQPIPYTPVGDYGNFPTVNSIFGVFQDLDPSDWAGPQSPADFSINYQIMGKAPCRTLVFNMYHMGLFSCGYDENDVEGSTQTSQIVLYEGTNIIEVYVKNRPICMAWGDGKGLIGIQNSDGTQAYAPPGRNTGNWAAHEEAWRFSPSGESTAEFSWEKDGEFFSSEPEIEISVNESAKYVARAKYELCGEEFNLTKTFNFLKENFVIGPVEDLIDCSRKPGELNEFDLSSNTALALGDFDADDYTIEYFGSEEDAESGENPLPDVYQRQGGQTIYVKMTNKNTECYKTKAIKLIKAEPINITQSANLSVCESYTFPVIEPGEAFYTQPYGEGDKYETGDVFSDIGVHKFYIYRVDEHGCFGQSEFELEIVEAPVADIIPDMVLECETFTLPTPSAYNKYYTLADKGGTEIPAGTEIILPSTIYIYAERKGDDGAVCIDQSSFTIDYKDCPLPRGFSPNGDGLNDFYDLDGYGVSSIKIFNRNGVEVYTQGVYKGEWYGQDKSGKALPSGTYYYVIVSNGKTRTGWIQLNR
jgi:gliding motility-associated-like protein